MVDKQFKDHTGPPLVFGLEAKRHELEMASFIRHAAKVRRNVAKMRRHAAKTRGDAAKVHGAKDGDGGLTE